MPVNPAISTSTAALSGAVLNKSARLRRTVERTLTGLANLKALGKLTPDKLENELYRVNKQVFGELGKVMDLGLVGVGDGELRAAAREDARLFEEAYGQGALKNRVGVVGMAKALVGGLLKRNPDNAEQIKARLRQLETIAPRMSDGAISPAEVGMMSRAQREKWEGLKAERFELENQLRKFEHGDVEEFKNRAKQLQSRKSQLESQVKDFPIFYPAKFASTKDNNIKKAYREAVAELSAVVAELESMGIKQNPEVPYSGTRLTRHPQGGYRFTGTVPRGLINVKGGGPYSVVFPNKEMARMVADNLDVSYEVENPALPGKGSNMRNPVNRKSTFHQNKLNAERAALAPGQIVRFDGNEIDGPISGLFDVHIVQNLDEIGRDHDNNGHRIIPRSLVENLKGGRQFVVYNFMLRPKKQNPRATSPDYWDKTGWKKVTIPEIKAVGMDVWKSEDGEYRVNIPGKDDRTAYYTDDKQDAIGTARAMAGHGSKQNPGGRFDSFFWKDLEDFRKSAYNVGSEHKGLSNSAISNARKLALSPAVFLEDKFAAKGYNTGPGAISAHGLIREAFEDGLAGRPYTPVYGGKRSNPIWGPVMKGKKGITLSHTRHGGNKFYHSRDDAYAAGLKTGRAFWLKDVEGGFAQQYAADGSLLGVDGWKSGRASNPIPLLNSANKVKQALEKAVTEYVASGDDQAIMNANRVKYGYLKYFKNYYNVAMARAFDLSDGSAFGPSLDSESKRLKYFGQVYRDLKKRRSNPVNNLHYWNELAYEAGYSTGKKHAKVPHRLIEYGPGNTFARQDQNWLNQLKSELGWQRYTDTQDATVPAYDRGYMDGFSGKKKRRVSNPAGTQSDSLNLASQVSEGFHQRPVKEIIDQEDELFIHTALAKLGDMVSIKVKLITGGVAEIQFDPNTATCPMLCSDPEARQLYLEGGDQSVNLSDMGFDGAMADKDKVKLGTITEITYRTEKSFDNFEQVDYFHKLGEESGVKPDLIYDTHNEYLMIVGGDYTIEDRGIVN
jgi:hypothetical protein